jgi:SAM-dependent methyltransferase
MARNRQHETLVEEIVLATEDNFDEKAYLLSNPDVAAGVKQGIYTSGREHFDHCGRHESRRIKLVVDREDYRPDSRLSTPLPDGELMILVVGHSDRRSFDSSRRGAVEVIVELLADSGVAIVDIRSVLDFGCGCGRILAGWEGMLRPEAMLHGCDINERFVAFCQENVKHALVVRSSYLPPLPYADRQFDFLYAASVYTHMSLPAMLQWTGEIARIRAPGGIAMITTHGSYYAPALARLSKPGSPSFTRNSAITFTCTANPRIPGKARTTTRPSRRPNSCSGSA